MKSSQTRFVRGAYSAQIPGMFGVFSVSPGCPVYSVARILLTSVRISVSLGGSQT